MNKQSIKKTDIKQQDNENKEIEELNLSKVLEALGAEASTYKHAGMTHISSLLADAT
jgi:hypothetical protein